MKGAVVAVRDRPLANVYMWWERVQVEYGHILMQMCTVVFRLVVHCWLVRCCVELENG